MTNSELIKVKKCLDEILDSKEIKQQVKEGFKVAYASNKNLSKIKTAFNAIVEAEKTLVDNYNKEVVEIKDKDAQNERQNLLSKDLEEMYSQPVEVELHKIDESNDEVIVKYLTGESTKAYLDFLSNHQEN